MKHPRTLTETLNNRPADEDNERISHGISDEARVIDPVNFALLILTHTLTKLGDALSSTKTVLAWMLALIGAPAYFVAMLVPIRESGSLIPQLFIAGFVRRHSRRKWLWVYGSLLQAAAVIGMGATALSFDGARAGWLIILLLAIFAVARGFSSISSKDVLGKTIPKTRRGLVNGLSAATAGFLTMGAGLYFMLTSHESASARFFGLLLIGTGTLWLIAAALYAAIREPHGEIEESRHLMREILHHLNLLRTHPSFRLFVIARSLFLFSALTAPYYVVLAQQRLGNQFYLLVLFIISGGLASALSATIWGRLADRSSRRVLLSASSIAVLLGGVLFIIVKALPALRDQVWIYPAAFFILGIAHSGVRIGRKTYLVDIAAGNRRTSYVAVSNTVIGVVLLLAGVAGSYASFLPPESMIAVLSAFGALGVLAGSHLPEVEQKIDCCRGDR